MAEQHRVYASSARASSLFHDPSVGNNPVSQEPADAAHPAIPSPVRNVSYEDGDQSIVIGIDAILPSHLCMPSPVPFPACIAVK